MSGTVSNKLKILFKLAAIISQLLATFPSLLIGWKAKAIAVKKLINSPIDFSPDIICGPPYNRTLKNPKPTARSTRAGIDACPATVLIVDFTQS